ncbi:helix-turn-helix domain-containing protein [Nocardioides jensenii]|uniref:helix-turn-helix domain-containing protein n=1 Tax=Nocardioides jensenii TaxID=1843 RepID=UPI00082BCD83|nr:helix-turn-helix domain-containing protein [Nocardioides jensenii]
MSTLPNVERRLLPYKLAAAYLGISERSMKQLAAEDKVAKVPIGHRVLFDKADLDAFIERIKKAS